MYAISKDSQSVKNKYGIQIDMNISQMWKIVRSPACKPGEYALFLRNTGDKDKFSIFKGYVSYNEVCKWFEIVKYTADRKVL